MSTEICKAPSLPVKARRVRQRIQAEPNSWYKRMLRAPLMSHTTCKKDFHGPGRRSHGTFVTETVWYGVMKRSLTWTVQTVLPIVGMACAVRKDFFKRGKMVQVL